ncbi:hypothetical protein D3C71_1614790 [compost metagenome]
MEKLYRAIICMNIWFGLFNTISTVEASLAVTDLISAMPYRKLPELEFFTRSKV